MAYPYQIQSKEQYDTIYQKSIEDPEGFWAGVATHFQWRRPWERILDWNFEEPRIEWFKGAQLNITENCLDRHLEQLGDQPAIIWEPNDPEAPGHALSYRQLLDKVMQLCHVLQRNGVRKGDRVCIYMGMVPELAIATLACARIGAIHSIVFGGFSAHSIIDRLQDAQATFVITADGAYRGNKDIPLKSVMDEALEQCDFVRKVLVLRRTGITTTMTAGRDLYWEDEIEKVAADGNPFFPAELMDAEDPLFILYTSGSTGKPKGVVHTCGGYMVYAAYSFVNVFQYQPGEVYFCTADIGWITGHSYIVYGPLLAGATTLIFEGIPTWPDAGRFWDIVDKHKVNILYTAPTAIRSLMSFGTEPVEGHDLSSLRVLGSVGEPINEEAWQWFHEHIGKGRCPLVDTWWQTENGGILISNLAGVTPGIPTFATKPLPGIQPLLVDEKGEPALPVLQEDGKTIVSGNLCIRFPWPGMFRTTYGDHERFKQNYFATYPGLYFSGDGCYRDEEGNYRITGRVDDVLNVSGHRIGTAEVENAINSDPAVIESAIVGYPHDIKGQGIYAFVVCDPDHQPGDDARKAILHTVTHLIGAIAKPDKIQFVSGLPKTRSGKIMRRILRKIAEGALDSLGDTSTLLDPGVVEEIKKGKL
ncbi:acetate--CoA ligase [Taibaiella koreensis]|uniref:acetate--CoA ligase n=1 Tax=Taibaiella koreensis TaxID=1268548 RepID=UPI000E59B0A0|nr:acetate--CoA ligase [Taibaiella koreensis]